MRIGVLGYGSFGLVISSILYENGHDVLIWGRNPKKVEKLIKTRRDTHKLPDFNLPEGIKITHDLEKLKDMDLLVSALPSHAIEKVFERLLSVFIPCNIVSLTKGFVDEENLPSDFIHKMLPSSHIAVLSGPTIARELAKKLPTSAVLASKDMDFATSLQKVFSTSYFRIYTHDDVRGVELGGALKNILAIAAGMVDGLLFGMNAKGALLARGIMEMRRFALSLGAKSYTLMGLSGYGDLITTSFSPDSRNRTVGELLAKGKKLNEIMDELGMVAEGIRTSKIVMKIAEKKHIDLPITRVVYLLVNEEIDFNEARDMLLARPLKKEFYDGHWI